MKLPKGTSGNVQNTLNCCFRLIFFFYSCVSNVSCKCLWARKTLLPCNCPVQLPWLSWFLVTWLSLSLLKVLRYRKLMAVYKHDYATYNKLCRDSIYEGNILWRHFMHWALGLHSVESLNLSGLSVREPASHSGSLPLSLKL